MSLFIALYKKIFISMVTDFKDLIQSPSSSKKLRTWFCILLPACLFHARVEIQLQAATAQLGFIEWKIQSFHALFMQHTVFQIILLLTLLRQLSEKKKVCFFHSDSCIDFSPAACKACFFSLFPRNTSLQEATPSCKGLLVLLENAFTSLLFHLFSAF